MMLGAAQAQAAAPREELGAVDFFKRASEHLAQGRDVQALGEFRKSLAADPNFTLAQYNVAAIYLKLGYIDKAISAAMACQDKRCVDVLERARQYQALAAEEPAEDDCSLFSQLIALAPKSVDALKRRAVCYFSRGFVTEALNDLALVVQLDPSDSATTAQVAVGTFILQDQPQQALQMLRRCVSFDDEATACKKATKQLRKLQKMLDNPPLRIKIRDVVQATRELLAEYDIAREGGHDGALVDNLRKGRCHGLALKRQWDRAAKVCAEVRDVDEEFVPAMLVQAHLEKQSGSLNQAAQLVNLILRDHGDSDMAPLARELHDEMVAEQQRWRQQQQSQQFGGGQAPSKDLYKVLGVAEDADTRTIRKAYRELSKKFHPDKYKGTDLSEDEIMEKMQEINEAYEILSNEDQRRDYDMQRSGNFGGGGGSGGAAGFGGFGGAQGGAGFEDVFKQFFGGAGGHNFHFAHHA